MTTSWSTRVAAWLRTLLALMLAVVAVKIGITEQLSEAWQ